MKLGRVVKAVSTAAFKAYMKLLLLSISIAFEHLAMRLRNELSKGLYSGFRFLASPKKSSSSSCSNEAVQKRHQFMGQVSCREQTHHHSHPHRHHQSNACPCEYDENDPPSKLNGDTIIFAFDVTCLIPP